MTDLGEEFACDGVLCGIEAESAETFRERGFERGGGIEEMESVAVDDVSPAFEVDLFFGAVVWPVGDCWSWWGCHMFAVAVFSDWFGVGSESEFIH